MRIVVDISGTRFGERLVPANQDVKASGGVRPKLPVFLDRYWAGRAGCVGLRGCGATRRSNGSSSPKQRPIRGLRRRSLANVHNATAARTNGLGPADCPDV